MVRLKVVKLLKVMPSPADQSYKDAFTTDMGLDMSLDGNLVSIQARTTAGTPGVLRRVPLSSVHWVETLEDAPKTVKA